MDYYLIHGRGVLVEEFVRRPDFTTAGLRSSEAILSRRIRADPALSVVPITREQAVAARRHQLRPDARPADRPNATAPQADPGDHRTVPIATGTLDTFQSSHTV